MNAPEGPLGHGRDGHTTHDGDEGQVHGQGEEVLEEHGREERREGGLRGLHNKRTHGNGTGVRSAQDFLGTDKRVLFVATQSGQIM